MESTNEEDTSMPSLKRARPMEFGDELPTIKKAKKEVLRSFICDLCKGGFSRRQTVNSHFPRCVKKRGNALGKVWDSHRSCWTRQPDGTMGPSGTIPSGLRTSHATMEAESHATMDAESSPAPTFSAIEQPLFEWMLMAQLTSLTVGATRVKAEADFESAEKMYKMWRNMMPEGSPITVKPPTPSSTELQRQQAVIWLGNDVLGAYYLKADTFDLQLEIVKLERDILIHLSDWARLETMKQFLMDARGEDGPKLLEDMDSDNEKFFDV